LRTSDRPGRPERKKPQTFRPGAFWGDIRAQGDLPSESRAASAFSSRRFVRSPRCSVAWLPVDSLVVHGSFRALSGSRQGSLPLQSCDLRFHVFSRAFAVVRRTCGSLGLPRSPPWPCRRVHLHGFVVPTGLRGLSYIFRACCFAGFALYDFTPLQNHAAFALASFSRRPVDRLGFHACSPVSRPSLPRLASASSHGWVQVVSSPLTCLELPCGPSTGPFRFHRREIDFRFQSLGCVQSRWGPVEWTRRLEPLRPGLPSSVRRCHASDTVRLRGLSPP
jgi:hypothetical protein